VQLPGVSSQPQLPQLRVSSKPVYQVDSASAAQLSPEPWIAHATPAPASCTQTCPASQPPPTGCTVSQNLRLSAQSTASGVPEPPPELQVPGVARNAPVRQPCGV
jgi:hypothetical protein